MYYNCIVMSRTTLQVPLDTSLRNKAEKTAKLAGFSSVQEVVRVFLNKFAGGDVGVGFFDNKVKLSEEAEKRYAKMVKEAKKGKGTIKAESLDELMSLLD